MINSGDYRYGFNGQEKLDEIAGVTGSHLDFGARIYDSRLGKFLSTDPWESKYAWQTPYAYFANSPISTIDWKGFGDTDDKKTSANTSTTETVHSEKIALNKPKASTVNIELVRTTETSNSTIGTFNIDNGEVEGYILEEAGGTATEQTTAGSDKRINEGTYDVLPYSSTKYPDNYELQDVEGRSKILIHVGNTAADTEGCLLCGSTKSKDFVGGSSTKYNAVNNYIKKVQSSDKSNERRGSTKIVIKITTAEKVKTKAFKQQKYKQHRNQMKGIY
jgi:RHS repeat-associated protein